MLVHRVLIVVLEDDYAVEFPLRWRFDARLVLKLCGGYTSYIQEQK